MRIFLSLILILVIGSNISYAQNAQDFDTQVQNKFLAHFNQYKHTEYFSGATLSLYIPNQKIKSFYLGRLAHDPKSDKVSGNTLFQIGSITKSFTAAIILQLEKSGKLNLNNPLREWLPQYKKWSGIHINELLNMTSDLPNYTDTPLFGAQVYYNLSRQWKPAELIDYVYPAEMSPPLKTGFFYSNTNYILAELIIEKANANSFQHELMSRMIQPAELKNTIYRTRPLELKLRSRLAHGYNYNPYENPSLVGKDTYENNLSWAAAAGGIISNSEDIIKWVQALFVNNKILDTAQKKKLMSLVSQKNGKAIVQTSAHEPRGFGLGVAQADVVENGLGRFWYFEGKTLGFRAIYWYKACNGVIISAIFNSATDDENDHVGALLKQLYPLIISQYPQLKCQDA